VVGSAALRTAKIVCITHTMLSKASAMPKSTTSIPSYRLHKRSGQAIVTLSGRMFYLGPYGTAESRERYNAVVGQRLANCRRWSERPIYIPVRVHFGR
jgi:hypothetical protein